MNEKDQRTIEELIKVRTIDDVPVLGVTLWSHRYDSFALRRLAADR